MYFLDTFVLKKNDSLVPLGSFLQTYSQLEQRCDGPLSKTYKLGVARFVFKQVNIVAWSHIFSKYS